MCIRDRLDEVAEDASVLAMDREELMEEFMIAYQDTLMEIGLDNREIARMAMAAIVWFYFYLIKNFNN